MAELSCVQFTECRLTKSYYCKGNVNCTLSDAVENVMNVSFFWFLMKIQYYAIFPINLVTGLFGNAVSMAALWKKYKQNKIFAHQFVVITRDMIELFVAGIWLIFNMYLGRGYPGVAPIAVRQSHAVVWFAGSLAYPLWTAASSWELFVMLGVCADQLQAMYSPIKYKQVNHLRRSILVSIFSLVLMLVLSIQDPFRYLAVFDEKLQVYSLVSNLKFRATTFAIVMGSLREAVRFLAFVALTVGNLLIYFKYRQLKKTKTAITTKAQKEQAQAGLDTKTLLKLLITQSALVSVATSYSSFACVVGYFAPKSKALADFGPHYYAIGKLLGCVAISWNFIFYCCMSREFRQYVYDVLLLGKKSSPISTGSNTNITSRKETATQEAWATKRNESGNNLKRS